MNQTNGILVVIIGLLVLYVVITGKYDCFETFFRCLLDLDEPAKDDTGFSGRGAGGEWEEGTRNVQENINRLIQNAQDTAQQSRILAQANLQRFMIA